MFPGLRGGLDPKQMQRMMRQFGVKSEEIPVTKVIFEMADKKLIINEPSVTVVDVQGKKTYTVLGEAKEAEKGIPKEDIEMVAKQANVDKEKAKAALKKNDGDIAAAILELKGDE